jgi:hypothetical protein
MVYPVVYIPTTQRSRNSTGTGIIFFQKPGALATPMAYPEDIAIRKLPFVSFKPSTSANISVQWHNQYLNRSGNRIRKKINKWPPG